MGAQTTKGYPYPVGTDRVMDGDNAMQALAEAVDTKAGVACQGQVMLTTTALGAVATVAVTFPAGLFGATTPKCFATYEGNPTNRFVGVSAPTATSVNVVLVQAAGNLGTFPVNWHASLI